MGGSSIANREHKKANLRFDKIPRGYVGTSKTSTQNAST